MIRAGAVAKDGIARKIGDNNNESPNKTAVVTSDKEINLFINLPCINKFMKVLPRAVNFLLIID